MNIASRIFRSPAAIAIITAALWIALIYNIPSIHTLIVDLNDPDATEFRRNAVYFIASFLAPTVPGLLLREPLRAAWRIPTAACPGAVLSLLLAGIFALLLESPEDTRQAFTEAAAAVAAWLCSCLALRAIHKRYTTKQPSHASTSYTNASQG